jgi:hypothetical protein
MAATAKEVKFVCVARRSDKAVLASRIQSADRSYDYLANVTKVLASPGWASVTTDKVRGGRRGRALAWARTTKGGGGWHAGATSPPPPGRRRRARRQCAHVQRPFSGAARQGSECRARRLAARVRWFK